jgi:hypothetical protein
MGSKYFVYPLVETSGYKMIDVILCAINRITKPCCFWKSTAPIKYPTNDSHIESRLSTLLIVFSTLRFTQRSLTALYLKDFGHTTHNARHLNENTIAVNIVGGILFGQFWPKQGIGQPSEQLSPYER